MQDRHGGRDRTANSTQVHPFEHSTTNNDSRCLHGQSCLTWQVRNLLSSVVHMYLDMGPSLPTYAHLMSTHMMNPPRSSLFFFFVCQQHTKYSLRYGALEVLVNQTIVELLSFLFIMVYLG